MPIEMGRMTTEGGQLTPGRGKWGWLLGYGSHLSLGLNADCTDVFSS